MRILRRRRRRHMIEVYRKWRLYLMNKLALEAWKMDFKNKQRNSLYRTYILWKLLLHLFYILSHRFCPFSSNVDSAAPSINSNQLITSIPSSCQTWPKSEEEKIRKILSEEIRQQKLSKPCQKFLNLRWFPFLCSDAFSPRCKFDQVINLFDPVIPLFFTFLQYVFDGR